MQIKPSLAPLIAGAFLFTACNINDFIDLSNRGDSGSTLNQQVVMGLRTALDVGIDSSAKAASRLNGYFAHKIIKILLPEEAAQALKAAEEVGKLVEPFKTQLSLMQSTVNLTSGIDKN